MDFVTKVTESASLSGLITPADLKGSSFPDISPVEGSSGGFFPKCRTLSLSAKLKAVTSLKACIRVLGFFLGTNSYERNWTKV